MKSEIEKNASWKKNLRNAAFVIQKEIAMHAGGGMHGYIL